MSLQWISWYFRQLCEALCVLILRSIILLDGIRLGLVFCLGQQMAENVMKSGETWQAWHLLRSTNYNYALCSCADSNIGKLRCCVLGVCVHEEKKERSFAYFPTVTRGWTRVKCVCVGCAQKYIAWPEQERLVAVQLRRRCSSIAGRRGIHIRILELMRHVAEAKVEEEEEAPVNHVFLRDTYN